MNERNFSKILPQIAKLSAGQWKNKALHSEDQQRDIGPSSEYSMFHCQNELASSSKMFGKFSNKFSISNETLNHLAPSNAMWNILTEKFPYESLSFVAPCRHWTLLSPPIYITYRFHFQFEMFLIGDDTQISYRHFTSFPQPPINCQVFLFHFR